MTGIKTVLSSFQVSTYFHPFVSHDLTQGKISGSATAAFTSGRFAGDCRLGELAATQYRKSRARSLKAAASRRYFTFFPLPPKWELFFVTEASADNRRGWAERATLTVMYCDWLQVSEGGRSVRMHACTRLWPCMLFSKHVCVRADI